jgi:hypothetical protein
MNGLLQDVRYALRQLRKSPGFTAIAVITLALGIGANTAIFSVIDSALIESLPYPNPKQLVRVRETLPDGRPNGSESGGAFKDWREYSSKFSGLAIYEDIRRNLTGMGTPERVTGLQVSSEFLSLLGVTPILGRDFAAKEDAVGGNNRVILLSHQFWQTRFGEDSNVLGKSISLDQIPYTVIGVLPPNALLQDATQALIPASPSVLVRTALPPLTLAETVRKTILEADPDQPIANVRTLEQDIDKSLAPRRTTLILLGMFAFVAVTLACIGIYGVVSYAIGQRARELSIRSALGAQRRDIVRLVLQSGMKLSIAGIVIGLLASLTFARLLQSQLFEVQAHDPAVFMASIGLLGLVAVLSVYLPARRAAKADPMVALRYE